MEMSKPVTLSTMVSSSTSGTSFVSGHSVICTGLLPAAVTAMMSSAAELAHTSPDEAVFCRLGNTLVLDTASVDGSIACTADSRCVEDTVELRVNSRHTWQMMKKTDAYRSLHVSVDVQTLFLRTHTYVHTCEDALVTTQTQRRRRSNTERVATYLCAFLATAADLETTPRPTSLASAVCAGSSSAHTTTTTTTSSSIITVGGGEQVHFRCHTTTTRR